MVSVVHYYLVVKEPMRLMVCVLGLPVVVLNFLSIERITSDTSFESKMGIRVKFPKDIT